MLQPRYRWRFPGAVEIDPGCLDEGLAKGISRRLLAVLTSRGVGSPRELAAFLGPAEAGLHDSCLLPDAELVAARVERARAAGERVMVFGDFDADGLTGLAILTVALRLLGLDVEPHVPRRLEEGHGLSQRAVAEAAAAGRSLIVTVDTGTSSGPEIEAARRLGIDVIVTDHHHVPPAPLALVNAHRPDSRYPDTRLTGSGIALKVAQLLLPEIRFPAPDVPGGGLLGALAELAMVGTVADVGPIMGENRAIARLGLEHMRVGPGPGVSALLERAGVAAATADLETVAYCLAPRLNAAGRVGEAAVAARLLLAEDRAEAATLAGQLEIANGTRRDLTRAVLEEAEAILAAEPAGAANAATLVLGSWPVGVIGLVASRLAEDRSRPAVVATDIDGMVRGSCRSVEGFDVGAALESCAGLLTRYGGHPGAAGFELPRASWAAFAEHFQALAATRLPTRRVRELRVDLALPASEVDYRLLKELAVLEPTGPGNPVPLVAVLGLTVVRARSAAGGHTQLTLRRNPDVLDGIAFGWTDLAGQLAEGDRLDVVARLASRRFGGLESLQLDVKDAAPSGSHPEAAAILARSPAVAPAARRAPG